MIADTHLFFFHSKRFQPVDTEVSPIIKPLQIGIRLAEELKLHLLELSGTECKVTRCDLITERFTDLSDTKRDFLSGCTLYIFEVYENALCCLRTKIYGIFCILCNTLKCLEHQVELTDICKIMFATGRTR